MTRISISEVGARDGLQTEPDFVPTERKIELVNALARTGLTRIEVTGFAVMQNRRQCVENAPDTMAAEIAHHGKTCRLGMRLDRVADIAEGRARFGGANAEHQAFIGDIDKALGF